MHRWLPVELVPQHTGRWVVDEVEMVPWEGDEAIFTPLVDLRPKLCRVEPTRWLNRCHTRR